MSQEHFVKIDSHAHLTSDELFPDISAILKRAKDADVKRIININTDLITFQRGLDLAQKYPDMIFNTAATPPHDVDKEGESFFPIVKDAASQGQLIAIGESGLDSYYGHSSFEGQIKFFKLYIELALTFDLPLVIHCRGDEAFDQLFQTTKSYPTLRALLHCFTGTTEQAMRALENGWLISLSGIITFKKSTELRTTIYHLPLDRILIETDSPYLAPQSKRGKQNEPAFIGEVAAAIAEVKSVSLQTVCEAISKNTCAFFQI